MSTLVHGISQLVTCQGAEPADVGLIAEAAVVVQDGRIAWVGAAAAAPECDEAIDLGGRAVLPGFVDSHAHLVFAGDRAGEFTARMTGTPYDGGGIGVSMWSCPLTRCRSKAPMTSACRTKRSWVPNRVWPCPPKMAG